MDYEHTARCEAGTAASLAAIAEYQTAWPDYCAECNGWGMISFTENQSPLGSGEYWPLTMEEACGWCYGDGRCPRCGRQHSEEWCEHEAACMGCGWKLGDAGCPEPYECCCWEASVEAEEAIRGLRIGYAQPPDFNLDDVLP